MKRRTFITLLGGAAAWPLVARAQQSRLPRLAALMAFAENDPEEQARVNAFKRGFEALGWSEGSNIQVDWRFANTELAKMETYAAELVSMQPDVIFCENTPVVAALLRHTRSIPIVFVQVGDPLGSGFVSSWTKPGGNATGFTNFEPSLTGKWLELLMDFAPGTKRAAIIFNPQTAPTGGSYFLPSFQAAATAYGVQPIVSTVRSAWDVQEAVTSLGREPDGGLLVMPDTFLVPHRKLVLDIVARYRLPAIYPYRYWINDGGIIAYGIVTPDVYRRAASYVDRILKGQKSTELPVQQPTKFELVINVRAAKALGLEVPATLLARADEVIE